MRAPCNKLTRTRNRLAMPEIPLQNVLVTGAAGFIGAHLCAALASRGVRVTAVDLPSASWWRHDHLELKVERLCCDLTHQDAVHNLLNNASFDCIFHLAAFVDVERSPDLVLTCLNANVASTAYLLHAARARTRRVILAGTCEEYGNGPVPFDEAQREIAVSPYSWSKICTTHLAQLYSGIFDLPTVIVRPFLTYGPLQVNDMLIPAAIRAALRDEALPTTPGQQTRDLVFVTDVVEGMIAAAIHPHLNGQIINLGSGVETTIAELVTLIYDLCASRARPAIGARAYRPGETMHFYASSQRARQLLNWSPRVSLRDGLQRTIDWFRAHPQFLRACA